MKKYLSILLICCLVLTAVPVWGRACRSCAQVRVHVHRRRYGQPAGDRDTVLHGSLENPDAPMPTPEQLSFTDFNTWA